MGEIDWSVFDNQAEQTCTCRCGVEFRSHAKAFYDATDGRGIRTRKPCPGCGRDDNCNRVTTDPETMTFRG